MRWLKRSSRESKVLTNALVNSVALSAGGFLSAAVLRESELRKGINLYDEENNLRGKSKKCAKKAVIQTASTRIALASATVLAPGAIIFYLEKTGRMIPILPRIATELSVISIILLFGLPLSVALYSNQGKVAVNDLEKEFKD
jgi:hypothetical protein